MHWHKRCSLIFNKRERGRFMKISRRWIWLLGTVIIMWPSVCSAGSLENSGTAECIVAVNESELAAVKGHGSPVYAVTNTGKIILWDEAALRNTGNTRSNQCTGGNGHSSVAVTHINGNAYQQGERR